MLLKTFKEILRVGGFRPRHGASISGPSQCSALGEKNHIFLNLLGSRGNANHRDFSRFRLSPPRTRCEFLFRPSLGWLSRLTLARVATPTFVWERRADERPRQERHVLGHAWARMVRVFIDILSRALLVFASVVWSDPKQALGPERPLRRGGGCRFFILATASLSVNGKPSFSLSR